MYNKSMRILYVGDIMGPVGIEVIEKLLPGIRSSEQVDIVIAQAENVSEGKGMNVADYRRLQAAGVDGFTGGNHTIADKEIFSLLNDPNVPVTGPANMHDCPGPGYKYVSSPFGKILIISLLGKIVGRDAEKEIDNPLKTIDSVLLSQKDVERVATIVNFHGDFSSEKVVIGHYLDGKVSAVIGDHWHVPTADAQVLAKGTAHQTDVGMCGSLDSSLGVTFGSILPRWYNNAPTRNLLETVGRRQLNAVRITVDTQTGLATDIKTIRQIYEG
jgi:metallophosphoesterase (TIGR00282 family)